MLFVNFNQTPLKYGSIDENFEHYLNVKLNNTNNNNAALYKLYEIEDDDNEKLKLALHEHYQKFREFIKTEEGKEIRKAFKSKNFLTMIIDSGRMPTAGLVKFIGLKYGFTDNDTITLMELYQKSLKEIPPAQPVSASVTEVHGYQIKDTKSELGDYLQTLFQQKQDAIKGSDLYKNGVFRGLHQESLFTARFCDLALTGKSDKDKKYAKVLFNHGATTPPLKQRSFSTIEGKFKEVLPIILEKMGFQESSTEYQRAQSLMNTELEALKVQLEAQNAPKDDDETPGGTHAEKAKASKPKGPRKVG